MKFSLPNERTEWLNKQSWEKNIQYMKILLCSYFITYVKGHMYLI